MGPLATLRSVLQVGLTEGLQQLGVELVELVLGAAALLVLLAAFLYVLVSFRLAAAMERVKNL